MTVQSNEAIEDLQNTIEQLTRELFQLRLEVSELRRQTTSESVVRSAARSSTRSSRHNPSPPVADSATNHFSVGDIVEITNNRNGLRGSRGRVVAVTREQVQIDIPHLTNLVRRKYTNVRLIESTELVDNSSTDIEQ